MTARVDADGDPPLDFRKMARDGGPIAAVCAALATAVGGWSTARDLTTEVRYMRDAVTRLEVKVAAGEGSEARLREAEARLRELDARMRAVEAHSVGGK